jgi:hypothetical protein
MKIVVISLFRIFLKSAEREVKTVVYLLEVHALSFKDI